jgi:arginase
MTMTDQPAPLSIIGAASGLGAPDGRCGGGPQIVEQALQQQPSSFLEWHKTINPVDTGDEARLPEFLHRLADSCAALLQNRQRIAVVGGDHACAMGTWRGVAQTAGSPLGLIWIDAHLDAHTPVTSPRGFWHGMPVAALLGQMAAGGEAVIDPRHFCVVGARSFEDDEHALLQRLGVRIITMAEVGRLGLEAAMAEALDIATSGTVAYGISIDLDAIDPADAPGVGTPVVGGLRAAELLAWLRGVADDPRLRALELAEFNPVVDKEQRTLELLLQILKTASGADHESDH